MFCWGVEIRAGIGVIGEQSRCDGCSGTKARVAEREVKDKEGGREEVMQLQDCTVNASGLSSTQIRAKDGRRTIEVPEIIPAGSEQKTSRKGQRFSGHI